MSSNLKANCYQFARGAVNNILFCNVAHWVRWSTEAQSKTEIYCTNGDNIHGKKEGFCRASLRLRQNIQT